MPNVWLALGRGPGCAVLDLDLGDLDLGDLDLGDLDLGDLDQLRDSQADCLLIDKQTTNKQVRGSARSRPRPAGPRRAAGRGRRQQNRQLFGKVLNFYRRFPPAAPGQ